MAESVVARLAQQIWWMAPHTVVELGARDCRDSLSMLEEWPDCVVHAFECNPDTLEACRERANVESRLVLHERAVLDRSGPVTFHQIDTEKTVTSWSDGNPGASSLFRASGDYPVESYAQRPLTVLGVRLDEELEAVPGVIDLLWMDIQGSELLALEGLGRRIDDVLVVFTEVSFMNIYEGGVRYRELDAFLHRAGFRACILATVDPFQANIAYRRTASVASRRDRCALEVHDAAIRARCSAVGRFLVASWRALRRLDRRRHPR
jgi:FkbM family methyltransferase